jgi:hypothetical protein
MMKKAYCIRTPIIEAVQRSTYSATFGEAVHGSNYNATFGKIHLQN